MTPLTDGQTRDHAHVHICSFSDPGVYQLRDGSKTHFLEWSDRCGAAMTPDQERAMEIALNVKRTQTAIAAEILRAEARGIGTFAGGRRVDLSRSLREKIDLRVDHLNAEAAELEGQ